MTIFAAIAIVAEIVVRLVAPQDLSGSWTVISENGLRTNKSSGRTRHQSAQRVVEYRFSPPNLRGPGIPASGTRILVLGDSFTFGWLLQEDDVPVSHLQRMADAEFGAGRFQFLNAATGGWGLEDYVAYVEDFGPVIQPDIVLVILHIDDVPSSGSSNRYLVQNGKLLRRPLHGSIIRGTIAGSAIYQWMMERSHAFQLARGIAADKFRTNRESPALTPGSPIDASSAASTVLAQALFVHLSQLCRSQGAQLIVSTTGWQSEPAFPRTPTEAFDSSAARFFGSHSIAFADISKRSDLSHKSKLTIERDGHPNETGSRLIAEGVWYMLLEKELQAYHRPSRDETPGR